MDIAQLTSQPEELPLGARTFAVRPMEFGEWGEVQALIKRERPGPVERVAAALRRARQGGEPIDEATAQQMLDHAHRAAANWPPRVGSAEWFDALDQIEGASAELVYRILVRTLPELTRAQAREIDDQTPRDDFWQFLYFALFGQRIKKKETADRSRSPASPRRLRPSPCPSPSATSGRQSSTPSSKTTGSSRGKLRG